MATVKARGQITIVDLNDAKQIQLLLEIKNRVQMYNPDTKVYTPNFGNANNVVTPKVYVTGNGTNLVSQLSALKYDINGTIVAAGATNGIYSVAAIAAGGALTIKGNLTTDTLQIKAIATFHDKETGQDTTLECQDAIVKSSSAGALFQVVTTQPSGRVFDEGAKVTALTAEARCYRGGTQDTDGITYAWFKLNVSNGKWEAVSTGVANASGVSTLSVKADDVLNVQTYKVTAKDGSDTSESIVIFEDHTDPYTLEVVSTTGDKIVNGQGTTTLMARIYRGTEKIEDETTSQKKFTYTWTKYDKAGNASNFNGTTSNQKTGNPLVVEAADINQKATFFCEVSQ